jgi:hypothetical protein
MTRFMPLYHPAIGKISDKHGIETSKKYYHQEENVVVPDNVFECRIYLRLARLD